MSDEVAIEGASASLGLHKEAHYWWRRMSMYLALGLFVSISTIAFQVLTPEKPVAIGIDPEGRVFPLIALNESIMSEAALANWIAGAITESFTIGHHDWKMRLSQIEEHFTEEGYVQFIDELNRSKVLPRLKSDFQLLTAVPNGTPVKTNVVNFGGRQSVTFEIPYLFTFHKGQGTDNKSVLVKVLAIRTELNERVRGMGIQQVLVEQRS